MTDKITNIENTRGDINLPFGIYIHIPFCKKKCNYCDFVSIANDNLMCEDSKFIDKYLQALSNEITSKIATLNNYLPKTIYIGGGTPSILSEKQIIFLFENLYKNLKKQFSNEEIETIFEVNPESITSHKLETLKIYGVNRLSFGLQSYNDRILKFLGRIHTVKDFCSAYDLAKRIGYKNINVDLMFGIPEQSLDDWKETLNKTIDLNPEHISIYGLTIEAGTKFFSSGITVNDDLSADMYKFAIEFLKEKGYHHYEISNFSKKGYECLHNINYWQNNQYYGFGLGATSYINKKRIKNTEDIKEYINGKYDLEFEELGEEKKMSESLMLGLRLIDGVIISDSIKIKYNKQINNLKNLDLLIEHNNLIRLSDKGIMYANCVFREFL
ncbi:MAG: hypothetical protein A2474_04140 [Elusimicrobia bacterium RIFOXYC2_FULL_34_12]|nr:MAG: hypothetical protein A2474_04140 [Elusimicrobia bacterium RIFOXYC2_FULL_34_12]OGS38688.1 MAG: hypothetical protein A2551_01765 [Elusimicrobia bacterium RIFOXYD2_FULL_34_30]HAM39402.1 coproporphyrinogen III oxidase [Elusimicrobiota bacterium]